MFVCVSGNINVRLCGECASEADSVESQQSHRQSLKQMGYLALVTCCQGHATAQFMQERCCSRSDWPECLQCNWHTVVC